MNFLALSFLSNHIFAGVDAFARRPWMSIFVVFLLSFGGSLGWGFFRGIPVPYVQDEFSYLLAGDTFAHGRITNPTHPMYEYFETFWVLQKPSYMSIYQPGQGFFLAIGEKMFGHPIYGVWLSTALMCAAICWMLYAWVSPRWAMIGGLAAVLQFSIFTYWSQSYWGGAVPALGGALVLGALPRIFKTQSIRGALWLGLGCAVLINSRPLEGFLIAIPIGCLTLPWKVKWGTLDKLRLLKNVVLPVMVLLSATIILTGTYNKKITGNAREFPHLLYSKLSSTLPVCIWQPLYPPVHYNHRVWADFTENSIIRYYLEKRIWKFFVQDMQRDSFGISAFYFGYPLAIPLLAVLLFFLFHHRAALRFWMVLLILLGACANMAYYAQPHYFASLTCLVVLLITFGLRGLAGLTFRHKRVGLMLVIFLFVYQLFLNILLTPRIPEVKSLGRNIQSPSIGLPASFTREELKNILMKRGGKYLVIVKYPLSHNYHFEWVYNDADIDHAPIVWARDMDGQNKKLLEYFKDRQVLHIMVYWDLKKFVKDDARQ
jgi:hypothetical protein